MSQPLASYRIADMVAHMERNGFKLDRPISRRLDAVYLLSHMNLEEFHAVVQETEVESLKAYLQWIVKQVRAVGLVDTGKQHELSFQVGEKPLQAQDLRGAIPTVSQSDGAWSIEPTRLFLSFDVATEAVENMGRKKPRTEEAQ